MAFQPQRFTRRGMLRLGGALAAVVALLPGSLQTALGQRRQVMIYVLDPNCSHAPETCDHPTDTRPSNSCNVCKACIEHARNKRWASPDFITRAHPCCRCAIRKTNVSVSEYQRMFGTGRNARADFDFRWV